MEGSDLKQKYEEALQRIAQLESQNAKKEKEIRVLLRKREWFRRRRKATAITIKETEVTMKKINKEIADKEKVIIHQNQENAVLKMLIDEISADLRNMDDKLKKSGAAYAHLFRATQDVLINWEQGTFKEMIQKLAVMNQVHNVNIRDANSILVFFFTKWTEEQMEDIKSCVLKGKHQKKTPSINDLIHELEEHQFLDLQRHRNCYGKCQDLLCGLYIKKVMHEWRVQRNIKIHRNRMVNWMTPSELSVLMKKIELIICHLKKKNTNCYHQLHYHYNDINSYNCSNVCC